MTTLANRPNTALLVVDLQHGVVDHAYDHARVVANAASLVEGARGAGVPVVWVQHSSPDLPVGSDAWQFVAPLAPARAEPVVAKTYPDAFEGSELEPVLAGLGVGRLLLAGAQTDECIRSTLHGAIVRGYDIALVSDAHTTEDLTEYGAPPPQQVIAHTNLYWQYHRAPGRTAGIVATAEVQFEPGALGA